MLTENQKILHNKRLAELRCLSIDPILYYNIYKFLDKRAYVVVKDYKVFLFPTKLFENKELKKNIGSHYIDNGELILEIIKVYGIDKYLATNILKEWQRDKIIYSNMSLSNMEYWDYLILPLSAKEIEEDDYNF
jgi:hypothetical protein